MGLETLEVSPEYNKNGQIYWTLQIRLGLSNNVKVGIKAYKQKKQRRWYKFNNLTCHLRHTRHNYLFSQTTQKVLT